MVTIKDSGDSDDDALAQSKRGVKFHFVMAASAMYMAMLLTSWGSFQEVEESETGIPSPVAYDLNVESMWIKIVTQWYSHLSRHFLFHH
jgi:hypothetical protein